MKLNKNQSKFFHVAVNHFGDKSTDVRFKDLKTFAEEMDLIIPTSALKKYCQEDGQVRGHYNLTLTGFEPEEIEVPEPEFEIENIPVITEVSSFVPDITPKKSYVFTKGNMKPMKHKNAVFVVTNPDFIIISIHDSAKGAYEAGIKYVLHDEGDRNAENVELELTYTGVSTVDSINSWIYFTIQVFDLKR